MSPGRTRIVTAAATDIGRRRSDNQDRYAVWTPDHRPAATLLVVCDGMGGAKAGGIASALAVDTVVRIFRERGEQPVLEALAHAVESANHHVWEQGQSRPELHGMGTTCTAVALDGTALSVAHVGDSRAYLVRDGAIRQLTSDHSLVAHLVATGQITEEDARNDPRRNVVTRSVGVSPAVEVEATRLDEPLRPGDTVVVCSDGLHGRVSDAEIAYIASGPVLDRACQALIALANERGGPDNITVVMARAAADEVDTRHAPDAASIVAAIVIAMGALAWAVSVWVGR